MSLQNNALYGGRLYDSATYSSNEDPQTFSVPLSDSAALSELDVQDIGQALSDLSMMTEVWHVTENTHISDTVLTADSLSRSLATSLSDSDTMLDSIGKSVSKVFSEITTSMPALYGTRLYSSPLYSGDLTEVSIIIRDSLIVLATLVRTDSLSMADARYFNANRSAHDVMAIVDSRIVAREVKALRERLLIQSWVELRLCKADPWTSQSAQPVPAAAFPTYGQTLYDQSLYGSTVGITWTPPSSPDEAWTNDDTLNDH